MEVEFPFQKALTLAENLMAEGLSASAAAKKAAAISGHKKGDIYKQLTK